MALSSKTFSVCVVGTGAVGTAIAVAFDRAGFNVRYILSRTQSKARRLASRLQRCEAATRLPPSAKVPSLVIIAVPDEQIAPVAKRLSTQLRNHSRALTVLHVSGAMTSDALSSLASQGFATGSLHPIASFPHGLSPDLLAVRLQGATYGFEGDERSERVARMLVRRMKGRCVRVPKEEKILYHITCVLFSNYAVALVDAATWLSTRLKDFRRNDFRKLTEESVAAAFEWGPRRALTGPIARGSFETVKSHRRILRRDAPELDGFYRVLGLKAVDLAVAAQKISRSEGKQMRQILQTIPVQKKKPKRVGKS